MSGLILEGVKKVRKVKPTARSWTSRKERAFLTSLAATCNVKLSAKRAGVSHNCVYERRNKNASFRASWDAALATGYAQLEMMMLERALHGVEKRVVARDGTTTIMREYSDRTALALCGCTARTRRSPTKASTTMSGRRRASGSWRGWKGLGSARKQLRPRL